ncbi:helix-turn-helix domain-containing protein [Thiotrichales bacterium 19S11-10]|nr:helix-turn-helix domain-containing protein [Thiotrichales bacterium 19S11-10]
MAKSFDQYLKERYSQKDIKSIKKSAQKKADEYLSFKMSIALALKEYMTKNKLGFNEIKKQLGTSDSQTSRILKGETNFTTQTIFKIAEVMGKHPKVVFE